MWRANNIWDTHKNQNKCISVVVGAVSFVDGLRSRVSVTRCVVKSKAFTKIAWNLVCLIGEFFSFSPSHSGVFYYQFCVVGAPNSNNPLFLTHKRNNSHVMSDDHVDHIVYSYCLN